MIEIKFNFISNFNIVFLKQKINFYEKHQKICFLKRNLRTFRHLSVLITLFKVFIFHHFPYKELFSKEFEEK